MAQTASTVPKETRPVSRQQSFTISRGNSFLSRSTSFYVNNPVGDLQTEGTIEETIKILSVKSPHEEHTGYRRDSTKFSTRDKLGFEFPGRVRRMGSGSTVVSRSYNLAGDWMMCLNSRLWLDKTCWMRNYFLGFKIA